jgi:hypothetical protein
VKFEEICITWATSSANTTPTPCDFQQFTDKLIKALLLWLGLA